MKKRKLSLTKRIVRGLVLFFPFLSFLLRKFIDKLDDSIQRSSVRFMDKYGLHEYERLNPDTMHEML